MAPDVDLLFGAYSGPTHGLGAAVIAGCVAWMWLRRVAGTGSRTPDPGSRIASRETRAARRRRSGATALAVAFAYASHTLLDWLGTDSAPPIGIMALWPVTRDYYESPLHVFMAISRRYWLPEFWTYNLRALGRELLFLLPLLTLVLVLRRRPSSS
jgi:LexA-binding, inner membrane-associated putative hydrolase